MHLTRLEPDNSALNGIDMGTPLSATTPFTTLLYRTGNLETGDYNFSAKDLVEMLGPFK